MPKHFFYHPDTPSEGEEATLNFSELRHAVKVLPQRGAHTRSA